MLTSPQRKYLRSLAHHLDPIVLVGKQGVTDHLVASVDQALTAHELIKVRFNDHKDQKRALVEEICARTKSEVAGILGHVAILYREHPEEEKRRVELPGG